MKNETFNYISPTESDKKWGIYLNVAGYAEISSGLDYPPKGHPSGYYFSWNKGRILNEYQINYITDGKGVIETEEGAYFIEPGSVLILRPGQWHRYRPNDKTGWRENYVGFDGEFVGSLLEGEFCEGLGPVVHVGFQERLIEVFSKIGDIVNEEKSGYQQVGGSYIFVLISEIISIIKNKDFEGKEIEKKIRKARLFLRNNLDKNVDVEALAFDLNLGYSYFRKMFKKFTGTSPVQYHLALRLQRSGDLLISTDKTIKQVAFELGFNSIYYFTRIFKKKMGVTPTEFRKTPKI